MCTLSNYPICSATQSSSRQRDADPLTLPSLPSILANFICRCSFAPCSPNLAHFLRLQQSYSLISFKRVYNSLICDLSTLELLPPRIPRSVRFLSYTQHNLCVYMPHMGFYARRDADAWSICLEQWLQSKIWCLPHAPSVLCPEKLKRVRMPQSVGGTDSKEVGAPGYLSQSKHN